MLARSGLPDEVDVLVSDHAFDVEKLDQFAGLLDELVVVVVEEENL